MTDNSRLDIINQRATHLGLPKQYFQKLYFLEQFLKQVSESPYKDDFILKGGFQIQSILWVQNRMTEDLDTTLNNHPVNEAGVTQVLEDIFAQSSDNLRFSVNRVKFVMDENRYPGLRVSLGVQMGKSRNTVKIDISTGDAIVPEPIKFRYESILGTGESFELRAYPPEQIIADKLMAMIKLGDLNTRAKDWFDFYAFKHSPLLIVNPPDLLRAYESKAAADKVDVSTEQLYNTIKALSTSEAMQRVWSKYQLARPYAKDISFEDTMAAAGDFAREITLAWQKLRGKSDENLV